MVDAEAIRLIECSKRSGLDEAGECIMALGLLLERSTTPGGGVGLSRELLGINFTGEEQREIIGALEGVVAAREELRSGALWAIGKGNGRDALSALIRIFERVQSFDSESIRQWLFSVDALVLPASQYDYPDGFLQSVRNLDVRGDMIALKLIGGVVSKTLRRDGNSSGCEDLG